MEHQNILETLETLVRTALDAGARIEISLTPKNWATDDNDDPAVIHANLDVAKETPEQ